MILKDLLLPEYIKVDMKAKNKNEAFDELINHYCRIKNSGSHNEIKKAILAREAKMSTGIQKGVAIPHGKTESVNTLCGVFGISKKGIQYDALDGEPVYLVFMIISPIEDSDNYLRLLKRLTELIEIAQFRFDLQAQKDPQNVYEVICKYEEKLNRL